MKGLAALLGLCMAGLAPLASAAQFDLQGPRLSITVDEGKVELPISQTPNLNPGDRIRIRPEFPADEAAHYLLVLAFLRGATNPPPRSWFHALETWTPKGRAGLDVTVPAGAGQVLVFLAPQTGGDFSTLVGAVSGRPGAFVRASQALNLARLNRSRYETFLHAVRAVDPGAPETLKATSAALARSLDIKLDSECFKKPPEEQADCLLQGEDSIVLTDGHSASLVDALTSESSAGLVSQLSASPRSGMKYYGPYVGSLIDVVHILESFRTAQYQYIPALLSENGDQASLILNAAPSFYDPKSVLVAALPEIEPAQPPPIRPAHPKAILCVRAPDPVLPAEGAPLIFSTAYARNLSLSARTAAGVVEIPVKASAEAGGLVLSANAVTAALGADAEVRLHGFWGFQPFEGPIFRIDAGGPRTWTLASSERAMTLVSGRSLAVELQSAASSCVDGVQASQGGGPMKSAEWKRVGDDKIEATLPLEDFKPGKFDVYIAELGAEKPERLELKAYPPESRIQSFAFHAGDTFGALTGSNLTEVAKIDYAGVAFEPDPAGPVNETLTFNASDPASAAKLSPGETGTARATLQDGRTLSFPMVVAAARPKAVLIGQSYSEPPAPGRIRVNLSSPLEVPSGASMTFSFRVEAPSSLAADAVVEIAADPAFPPARIGASNGLFLEDRRIGVVTLDTAKAFGTAASGGLKFRVVQQGAASDWIPLGTLVRLPQVVGLACHGGEKARAAPSPSTLCELTGSHLFMISAISRDKDLSNAQSVPEGYPGETLAVPAPSSGRLYITLRDAPDIVNALAFENFRGRGLAAGAPARPEGGARAGDAAKGAPRPDAAPPPGPATQ